MILTQEMLKAKSACSKELSIFVEVWPNGTEVTIDTVLEAMLLDLNIWWFTAFFFDEKLYFDFMGAVLNLWRKKYPRDEEEQKEAILIVEYWKQQTEQND